MIDQIETKKRDDDDVSPFKNRESIGGVSQTIEDDIPSNSSGSPAKLKDNSQKDIEGSPLPFSKLAGDEEVVKGSLRKNLSFFDRKSSLMNYGGGS